MLVWEALLGQVPLEGMGLYEAVLGTSCILAVVDVSHELEKSVQE